MKGAIGGLPRIAAFRTQLASSYYRSNNWWNILTTLANCPKHELPNLGSSFCGCVFGTNLQGWHEQTEVHHRLG